MPAEKHAAANALESGVQIGDFKIERRIGAGGMGIVYAARQLSLNRVVALKVLGQALTRGVDVSRFHREAQAAAMLKHPAIAQVYFIGQDQHLCYLAMELIEGVSLRQVIDRLSSCSSANSEIDTMTSDDPQEEADAKVVRFDLPTGEFSGDTPREAVAAAVNPYSSPLEPPKLSRTARSVRNRPAHVRRCCEIARDAAFALAHAHTQGVIHRDIKPDNLLLDRKRQVHLIDFGVARFFDDQTLTHTGQIVGTPIYMSPEQITGQKAIDARTDVYSLGVVLYELLTLRSPVESTSRENVFRSIITKALPPLSWVNASVPLELEGIVHRAAAKDPDDRYVSAQDYADDLQRFLDGKPVVAPPYRFRFDEGEIIAARPSGVIVSAFIILLGCGLLSMLFLSMTMMSGALTLGTARTTGGVNLPLVMVGFQGVCAVAIIFAGVVITRGVLAGGNVARWVAICLSSVVTFACAIVLVGILWSAWTLFQTPSPAPENSPQTFSMSSLMYGMLAMYGSLTLISLILSCVVVYSLLSRKAANWYRLAARIRGEHRNLRSLLQKE